MWIVPQTWGGDLVSTSIRGIRWPVNLLHDWLQVNGWVHTTCSNTFTLLTSLPSSLLESLPRDRFLVPFWDELCVSVPKDSYKQSRETHVTIFFHQQRSLWASGNMGHHHMGTLCGLHSSSFSQVLLTRLTQHSITFVLLFLFTFHSFLHFLVDLTSDTF